jgi:hypothetical protein
MSTRSRAALLRTVTILTITGMATIGWARDSSGRGSWASWRKDAAKDGKWQRGRYLKGQQGTGYYLVRKPSGAKHKSWNHPNGRGHGLFREDGAAINPSQPYKKHMSVSLVKINQTKGHRGRKVTVRRDHLSRGAVALETPVIEIGQLTSSLHHAGTLRTIDTQVLSTTNIKQMRIGTRHRVVGASKVKKEIDADGYQIGGTTIARGTKLSMFRLQNPNATAEIKIAPVVIDTATGHRFVDRDRATTISLPYRRSWSGADPQRRNQ